MGVGLFWKRDVTLKIKVLIKTIFINKVIMLKETLEFKMP